MRQRFLRKFYSLSLRTHLLLMTLLLALPALALVFYSGYLQREDAIHDGMQDGSMLVYALASEQHNLTGNVEQLLTALAQIPEIKERKVAATSTILADVLKKNPQYANIIVTDLSGMVWASGLPMRERFPVREAKSYQAALRTGRFSSGTFLVGRVSGKRSVGFGYPITDADGACAGAILANIDFTRVNDEMLRTAGLPEGSWYTIADCNGVIVDRSFMPRNIVGTRMSEESFVAMERGPDSATRIGPAAGKQCIISYRKLRLPHEDAPYLYIRACIPLRETERMAQIALLRNVATLLPVLLVAVFLVLRVGNASFVRRIGNLENAARRMADGDLDARVGDLFAGGELGRLGQAFDDMAEKLALREHALTELNQSLSRRVEAETELRVQRERVLARHARLVAMGEMIGAIAHQWRQPLATLGATVQSIRMAWERGRLDDTFLRRAESDAQKQLYYMSDTIEDFRNFFTPEKVLETFEIREKIAEVVLLVAARFSSAGIELAVRDNAEGVPLCVKGFPNEFKQSLLNLLTNAFDAVAEKEARGGAAGEQGLVAINVRAPSDRAVIEVLDNGCGIAADHAEKVFDPYFTTKPADKGTGIGLYMTRLIIEESMGGRLSFSSGAAGTLFEVDLARDLSGGDNHVG